jgi:preprotein translocase subunit SecY
MTLTRSQQLRKASLLALNFSILQAIFGAMLLSQGSIFGLLPAIVSVFVFRDFQTFSQISKEMKTEEQSGKNNQQV